MIENYGRGDGRYRLSDLLPMTRTDMLARLRELELRYIALPALADATGRTAASRRAQLARMDFVTRLAKLRAWVNSRSRLPMEAWRALHLDLQQLLEEAEGHQVKNRQDASITEAK